MRAAICARKSILGLKNPMFHHITVNIDEKYNIILKFCAVKVVAEDVTQKT